MTTPSNPSLCLILNERAASDPDLLVAMDKVRERGHRIETRAPTEAGQGIDLTKEAVREGWDILVAAGGDGTINEVVNGIMQAEPARLPAFGIIPYGTGNDFAKAAALPLDDPWAALEMMLDVSPIEVDVARVGERLFLNAVSGGQAAEVTTDTPAGMKKILGGFAYFLTGLAHALVLEPNKVRVTAPDFDWEGQALAVVVGNGRTAGGGYRVTRHAFINDGLLDLMLVPELPWTEYVELIREHFSAESPEKAEHIIYKQFSEIRIEAPGGFRLNLDGEPVKGESFRFDLLDRKLPCLIPAQCEIVMPVSP